MPYRLCGSDCNRSLSSLGRLLPCRGPPKLHRAEPHPWSEEGWQRENHKPGQLGTERAKSCIAPTPESRGPRRRGAARARHHRQVALETEVAELVALALALKPEPPPGSGQCSCGFVFWLLWVWFGFIKKPKKSFCRRPIYGGPEPGDSASWRVPQKDAGSAASAILQLQMDVQLLRPRIQKHAENKPQPLLPSQIRVEEAPGC